MSIYIYIPSSHDPSATATDHRLASLCSGISSAAIKLRIVDRLQTNEEASGL